jgi:hypothetical protein
MQIRAGSIALVEEIQINLARAQRRIGSLYKCDLVVPDSNVFVVKLIELLEIIVSDEILGGVRGHCQMSNHFAGTRNLLLLKEVDESTR